MLHALLTAVQQANVVIRHPRCVETVEKIGNDFHVRGEWGEMETRHVVLATGGKSLPKTGSDGHGYEIVKSLGHTMWLGLRWENLVIEQVFDWHVFGTLIDAC